MHPFGHERFHRLAIRQGEFDFFGKTTATHCSGVHGLRQIGSRNEHHIGHLAAGTIGGGQQLVGDGARVGIAAALRQDVIGLVDEDDART